MCERLLRQSVCLHSQPPPQKLCVDDESLDSVVLVRTGAAINEGASQPRRYASSLRRYMLHISCASYFNPSEENLDLFPFEQCICFGRSAHWMGIRPRYQESGKHVVCMRSQFTPQLTCLYKSGICCFSISIWVS